MFVLMLGLPGRAYAYVDPSVMTYTIQALAGVAVALSAIIGVAWRRCRRVIIRLFNIDENANKETEYDVHAVPAGANPPAPTLHGYAVDAESRQGKREKYAKQGLSGQASQATKKQANREQLPWKKRFLLSFAVSFLVCFIFFAAPSCELMITASDDLVVGLRDVWLIVLCFTIIVALAMALLLSALKGKALRVALNVGISLCLCAFIQSLFLNSQLPVADGNAVEWEEYLGLSLLSFAIWGGIIIATIVLTIREVQVLRYAVAILPVALFAVSAVSLVATIIANPTFGKIHVSEEGLFDVSSKNNVIMFVLDTVDQKIFQECLKEYPDTLDGFTGFTMYTNAAGSGVPTRYGVPFFLTYEYPHDDDTLGEFKEERYQRSSFLDDVAAAGYSMGVYSTDTDADTLLSSYTENIHWVDLSVDWWGVIGALLKTSLYRELPWAYKPFFWYYTDELNKLMVPDDAAGGENRKANDVNTIYQYDDARYYQKLQANGLRIEDNPNTQGTFRFIHLLGAHSPYIMDEKGQAVDTGSSDVVSQTRGAFRIVELYIEELKRLGVYDNATIIVTADHGYWWVTDYAYYTSCPVTLVKTAGTAQKSAASYSTSSAPVSSNNVAATILNAMGAQKAADKYAPAFNEVTAKNQPIRLFYHTASNGHQDIGLVKFEIAGNANNFDNWKNTGVFIPETDLE